MQNSSHLGLNILQLDNQTRDNLNNGKFVSVKQTYFICDENGWGFKHCWKFDFLQKVFSYACLETRNSANMAEQKFLNVVVAWNIFMSHIMKYKDRKKIMPDFRNLLEWKNNFILGCCRKLAFVKYNSFIHEQDDCVFNVWDIVINDWLVDIQLFWGMKRHADRNDQLIIWIAHIQVKIWFWTSKLS